MKRITLIIFASTFANTAIAQEAAPCGGAHAEWLAENAIEMTGAWIDTPVRGLLVGQPMPLGPPEPVEMTAVPNGFSARGEEPVRTYELLLTDEPFTIDPPGGTTELARIDSEDIPDCAIADLPRLEASYTLDIDGQEARGTIAAVVASTQRIHIWFALETGFGRVEQLSTMTR